MNDEKIIYKDPNEAMKELTMMLLYLSRFTRNEKFEVAKNFYSWKNYSYNILNELDRENYIDQGLHKTKSRSIRITEDGITKAKELLDLYGINDWIYAI